MLVRIFGKNFRSLRESFELSMVAADLTRSVDKKRGTIEVQLKDAGEPLYLLRVAAIFGHNAAGKSTVLTAANALRYLIVASSRLGEPGSNIPPYEPFLLDAKTRELPVTLGCDVVHKDEVLRYEVTYGRKAIESERMTLLSTGGEDTVLIDRQFEKPIKGMLIESSESNQLYVKEMQPNVTVISKLAQHGPAKGTDSIRPFYNSLAQSLRCADFCTHASGAQEIGVNTDRDKFVEDEKYRGWIMAHLMQKADVGINGVHTSLEEASYPDFIKQMVSTNPTMALPDKEAIISFVHRGRINSALDFQAESSGTKKLFALSDDWWELAHKSICLFADELSASLHPRLLDALIRGINEPKDEQSRSQLIFATHDTGLLESRDGLPSALRRDQVYFARKDVEGASEIYALAEFKESARPVHNLRKRYLSGFYGAIPSIEELPL